jgi:hypothetical protein
VDEFLGERLRPFVQGRRFGPLTQPPVKNVAPPLRHDPLSPLKP